MLQINLTKNKKFNKWLSKIIFAVHKDVSYYQGGWLFFAFRMITNAIYLYFTMIFIRAFFMFVFQANGVVDESELDTINNVLYAIGLLYLIFTIPRWREDKE